MSLEDWQQLVRRYADGRPLCNCRDAYYTPCGHGYVHSGVGVYEKRTDMLACQHGCDANRSICKNEIAARVLAELTARTKAKG